MFSIVEITEEQYNKLLADYHIYLLPNGRISFV